MSWIPAWFLMLVFGTSTTRLSLSFGNATKVYLYDFINIIGNWVELKMKIIFVKCKSSGVFHKWQNWTSFRGFWNRNEHSTGKQYNTGCTCKHLYNNCSWYLDWANLNTSEHELQPYFFQVAQKIWQKSIYNDASVIPDSFSFPIMVFFPALYFTA